MNDGKVKAMMKNTGNIKMYGSPRRRTVDPPMIEIMNITRRLRI